LQLNKLSIAASMTIVFASGIGGPDWYREKEKSVRNNLSGMCLCLFYIISSVLLILYVAAFCTKDCAQILYQ